MYTKSQTPLVEFTSISKNFKNHCIFKNSSFEIYNQEIVGLIGKSGSGKSTFLKILLGKAELSSGKIIYNSQELLSKKERKSRLNLLSKKQSNQVDDTQLQIQEFTTFIGYVPQFTSSYEELTVYQNVHFFAKINKVPYSKIKSRIKSVLRLVHLDTHENFLVKTISGGMKRRLELAIALVHEPKILILDEPFTGLDTKIKYELWNLLVKIKNSGVTIIISTHLLHSAQHFCDRFLVVNRQKIQELPKSKSSNLEKLFLDL